MFKQNLQQQSSNSGSSNGHMGDTDAPKYDVYELGNEDDSMQTKLLLKLTDECTAAIKNAIKSKSKIQMNILDGIAAIEIHDSDGNLLKFKCSSQNQPATDIIYYQKGKMYKNIGLTSTVKLQVQATDKTFAEMKEKTQKLVEAEQQKKAKDMPKMPKSVKAHKHSQNSGKISTLTTANIISKISSSNASKRNHRSALLPATTNMPVKKQKQDIELPKSKAKIDTPENSKILKKMEEGEKKKATTAKATPDANKQYSKEKPSSTVKKDLFNIPKHKHLQRAPSISPASTEISTPKTISPPTMACPPSLDNNIQMDEDMSHDVDQDDDQIPYIGSMTLAVEPSCNWRLQFGKISNEDEARRYYECFKSEYPEYHQCYEEMENVAEEFRKLQVELKKAKNDVERLKIEEEVRTKFAMYHRDQEFLRKRQIHHDLRMKLDVIKQALHEWSKQQQKQ